MGEDDGVRNQEIVQSIVDEKHAHNSANRRKIHKLAGPLDKARVSAERTSNSLKGKVNCMRKGRYKAVKIEGECKSTERMTQNSSHGGLSSECLPAKDRT